MIDILFLDWDGLLVESHFFYYEQVKTVFNACSQTPPSLKTFKRWVSVLGVKGFYEKYGIRIPYSEVRKIEKEYRRTHNEMTVSHEAHLLIAVCRTRNIKTIVLSNNHKGIIRKVLAKSHLLVDEVHSSKDKAESIIQIAQRHNVDPKNILFAGDTVQDILAGKKAGVKTLGYSGGYHTHAQIRSAQPDFGCDKKFSSLQQVTELIVKNT